MNDKPQRSNIERMFVDKLQSFFGRMYPPEQAAQIAKRFGDLNDEAIVLLYRYITENAKRLPVLAELIEFSNRMQRPETPVAHAISTGKMPWEVSEQKAYAKAKEYECTAMLSNPTWCAAVEEGWGFEARMFIFEWARCQAMAMDTSPHVGVTREMLGDPAGATEYDARREEMMRAIGAAKFSGVIEVPSPDWFVAYGRSRAARKSMVPPVYTANQAIRSTTNALSA